MVDCHYCKHLYFKQVDKYSACGECDLGLLLREDEYIKMPYSCSGFEQNAKDEISLLKEEREEERGKTMIKSLDPRKEYKVKGTLLHDILELSALYNHPCFIQYGGYIEKGLTIATEKEFDVIPFPSEKRDFLIGRIVKEVDNMEWEEI